MRSRGEASASVRAGGGTPSASESMRIINASDKRAIGRLLARGGRGDRALHRRVRTVVDRVRSDGDRALLRFARTFDGLRTPLEVTAEEMREQASRVAPDV